MTPEGKDALREAIALLRECYTTMNHARVFICTREKMHPDGQALYADNLARLKEFVGK